MNFKCFIKAIVFFIALAFVSCNDEEHGLVENKCQIICSVDEFESSVLSRTNTDPDNNFLITWTSGDVIGIFPREGYQEPFEIPTNQIGNTFASFDGGYWDVKDGLQYNAYYPFDKKNFDSAEMKTMIPVSYIGQKQNGTSCDIGAFDYTYSDWKTASGGKVSFDFHHIGAIAVFSLKYPATTTYTQLTLSLNEALIPLKGTYDLTAEDVSLIPDENNMSTSISLELNNCSGVAGETGVFYMMLPPMDLSNHEVTLSLTSSAGTTCTYSIEKVMNVKKGKLYQRTGVPKESNVEGTINGWGSSYSNGIACVNQAGDLPYIIPENEKYTITSLKISGELNGTDIRFIREMLGCDYTDNPTEGKLTSLDLSEASIVEGGGEYRSSSSSSRFYYTSNDEIGRYMFYKCSNLQNIVLPNNATSIGDFAFGFCSALTSVVIGDNVTSIGDYAFEYCSALTNVVMGDGMSSIAHGAFSCCKSLTTIEIGSGAIGSYAFEYCDALTSVVIGDGVTSIGADAFRGCDAFTNVYITDLSAWCKIDFYNRSSNPLYLNKRKLYLNNSLVTELTIHDDITEIKDYAFIGYGSLIKVAIPDHVTSIGNNAFQYCYALASVEIGDGVSSIGDYAFQYCNTMTSAKIGNGVSSIGDYAFNYCNALTSLIIGDGVSSIGEYAFSSCYSMASVYITDLSAWCKIDFYGGSSNPLCDSGIGKLYLNNNLVTELIIPDDITEIKDYAFIGCESLIKVTIPDHVTSIGEYAFNSCGALESAKIGDGVSSIGDYAFNYCNALTSLIIGDGVSSIGKYAFDSLLNVLYCYATIPPSIPETSFNYIDILYVPAGCSGVYKGSNWGKYFSDIIEMD